MLTEKDGGGIAMLELFQNRVEFNTAPSVDNSCANSAHADPNSAHADPNSAHADPSSKSCGS